VASTIAFVSLVGGLALLGGCSSSCPRAGCDALKSPATDSGKSAIAGAVASESDVVANGCQECSFSSTQLRIWKTSSAVTDVATAQNVMGASAPVATVHADGHYEQPLDPGFYLVCSTPDCASVEVVADHVTTLHLNLISGPVQFTTFAAGSNAARSIAPLEVGL
jgi:hypothetical protein